MRIRGTSHLHVDVCCPHLGHGLFCAEGITNFMYVIGEGGKEGCYLFFSGGYCAARFESGLVIFHLGLVGQKFLTVQREVK